ncbi:hypothetical protein A3K55_02100 [Candidatus Shapirobacteria bacterium RBG_13_44_7]|uniref:LysM domain-containing protein n=1 Tax=Candidatus Shapirobacteria bacterium RBG_13_44_7 TaxID=1802149 RepID=A0A1F7SGJ5_9BACT|nr:MAG: hypothetical protein A3K55_02100 [Candidatus Shapirobacteria bacterium RBG_13_44_7]
MLEKIKKEGELIRAFLELQGKFWSEVVGWFLGWMGSGKSDVAKLMYRQRGRFSQSFVNASFGILAFLALTTAAKVEDMIAMRQSDASRGSNYLILASEGTGGAETMISDLPKGETTEYRVQEGDTVSSIAQKFGVSIDTIVWENNLKSVDSIKPGQILKVLPVTGLRYKVVRGETVYSVAKKLQVDPQNIIDYPFNTFSNDETFALAAGQELIVPDGVKPKEVVIDTSRYIARTVAPIPGVVGEGNFIWPTTGHISQRSSWYHRAVDIANKDGPDVVAAQGGTVITAGWSGGGYGNFVIIDHGNGYQTLYAHMVTGSLGVKAGDKVSQGQRLGRMGSTGRSTGTHLHFEIKTASGNLDPLQVLK